MRKKWIVLLLALCLCLALAACAAKEDDDASDRPLSPQDEMDLLMGSMDLESPTPTPLEALYYDYSDYRNVLLDTQDEFADTMGSEYLDYGLCDLDGDGVLELLVREGTCEADYIWQVYTVGEMGAKEVGSFGGGHSALYLDDEDGVLCVYGQMGHERIDRVSYDGQYITVRTLQERDLADGEEYSRPGSPVALSLISDPGMIP